ncbi:hypothetical protein HD806DRAFT_550469 [Xylariaceae sp. AK1471]|nr:hypothetical protein HD806DRAFT_550469 [Xylariaceae sp. AK1471]
MKFNAKIASMLLAAAVAVAQDEYSPDYREINWDFEGTGKVYMHPGSTYWRQGYPRNITADTVGCLNQDGHLVTDEGDNCATFRYFKALADDTKPSYSIASVAEGRKDWLCEAFDVLCRDQDVYGDPVWTTLWSYSFAFRLTAIVQRLPRRVLACSPSLWSGFRLETRPNVAVWLNSDYFRIQVLGVLVRNIMT